MARRLAMALLLATACSRRDASARYLTDAAYRRATLESSLVNRANRYSRLRLEHYATGRAGDWDALPQWNPPVATLAADGTPRDDERALLLPLAPDEATLRRLGRDAFFRYPSQLAPWLGRPLTQPATWTSYGLWRDDEHGVGGIVSARLADGTHGLAMTCATCHSRIVDGVLVPGLANEALRVDALADGSVRADRWGPGRVDVALPPGEEPVAIPDLRPTALETHLHRDGSVARTGRVALAIRLETLLVIGHGGVVRPPRVVALALAAYLESLAPAVAPVPAAGSVAARGATTFAAHCAGCHVPPTFAGPPVALDVIGTDARVGQSADRGTGGYRVPSLRGVATRGRLLHDGSIADLATLFDPARTIAGHDFGLTLDATARSELLAYLATL
jgi:mono/diheme cytochrome c family protein